MEHLIVWKKTHSLNLIALSFLELLDGTHVDPISSDEDEETDQELENGDS